MESVKNDFNIVQSAPVNSTVKTYVPVNTTFFNAYLSANRSLNFTNHTLCFDIKHTDCLCVTCSYTCTTGTQNLPITFLFHLTLYVL
jgi:hypothetical protein